MADGFLSQLGNVAQALTGGENLATINQRQQAGEITRSILAGQFASTPGFVSGQPGAGLIGGAPSPLAGQALAQPPNIRQQLADLSQVDPQQALQFAQALGISLVAPNAQARVKSTFNDARSINSLLKAGQVGQAAQFINQRVQTITQAGGNPSDTLEIKQLIDSGDTAGAIALLDQVETAGVQGGFLKGGEVVSALDLAKAAELRAKTGKAIAETKEITGGPKAIETPKALLKGLQPDIAEEASAAFVAAGGGKDGVKALNDVTKIARAERTETLKVNIKRIAELSQRATSRNSSIAKAKFFLKKLVDGTRGSGTTRTIAGALPGVFTKQAEFDQKFNAFAEVAAREKLKAAGEVRPTDADVKGMKDSIFGIGRDEPVNIQLLNEFIAELGAENQELIKLRKEKKAGNLEVFTGTPDIGSISGLTDEELLNF